MKSHNPDIVCRAFSYRMRQNDAAETEKLYPYRPIDRTSQKVNYSELNACVIIIIYSFHIRTNEDAKESLHRISRTVLVYERSSTGERYGESIPFAKD